MIIVLTNTAKEDLENIYQYYNTINPHFAAQLHNNILEEIETLETFPFLAPVDRLFKNTQTAYRSLIILKGRIKVVYLINKEHIHILSIWDCQQNPETLLKRITRK